jgi:hypothetical protein
MDGDHFSHPITMILDHFDHIYIISLPHHKDRLARLRAQLKGLARANRITVVEAIHGEKLPAPAWWKQGNGAWGCYSSHVRVLQTVWQAGHKTALILEDDAILDREAMAGLPEFFVAVPPTWGQMYLGGQHQQDPEIKGGYFVGRSVNRTHAYAVRREAIPKILQHVQHAPDYINNPGTHIDHQLERAHMRRDWLVVCPQWWPFGQGENQSAINGRAHPDKWWDWAPADMVKALPWVIVPPEIPEAKLKPFRPFLHFGWTLANDNRTDVGIQSGMGRRTRSILAKSAGDIAAEAWSMRRLPAVCVKDDHQLQIFMEAMQPEIIDIAESPGFNLKQWADT